MNGALAITWNDSKKAPRVVAALVAVLAMVQLGATGIVSVAPDPGGSPVSVIVRELDGAGAAPEQAVADMGGEVTRRLAIIDGFVATVPEDGLPMLEAVPGIHSVTPNQPLQLQSYVDGWNSAADPGSMYRIVDDVLNADRWWQQGLTGRGVDVALIDSGVVPVNGLTAPSKVINGPDLSFESQVEGLRYLDTYGHGTHMAGIIAGRDNAAPVFEESAYHFQGVAPEARIVSIKVADSNGATDVSQVIAAIDWVVQHRSDNGMNIRVLNLSFGTDGVQDYRIDPLAYAAEVAWRSGIVVVVAAGNAGYGSNKLNNPAYDPFVIAVGAADDKGTSTVLDDVVATFSSSGNASRRPDILAPGKSIVSLRAPGSFIDEMAPQGRVGMTPRFFRGSGTSQAAAVVSGAAALIVQQRPWIAPDQVKALLMQSASYLPGADVLAQGAGMINLSAARYRSTPYAVQTWERSTGTGSLEAARGSAHVEDAGVALVGEYDILGPWDGQTWSVDSLAGRTWSGGMWNGRTWSGDCWCAASWSGQTWSGQTWSGQTWSGQTWSGQTWSGRTWSGQTWSAGSWDSSFLGQTWSGNTWSSSVWG